MTTGEPGPERTEGFRYTYAATEINGELYVKATEVDRCLKCFEEKAAMVERMVLAAISSSVQVLDAAKRMRRS